MNQYPKYKPANLDWLTNIPEHWQIKKLKYTALVQPSNINKKSVEGEQEVLLCNYVDVYKNEFIDASIPFMKATATADQIEKFALKKGDVLITKDSETPDDIAVPAFVVHEQENLICGYHLAQIRAQKELSGAYLFRLFQSKDFNTNFEKAANGITRYGLGVDSIKDVEIIIPPKEEQINIGQYLDKKIFQIQTFIFKKQKLIELLKEERKTLINEAVIKGIDLSTSFEKTGIDWIGDIPIKWQLISLKRIVRIKITDGPHLTPEFVEKGVPFISAEAIKESSIIDFNSKRGYITSEVDKEYSIKCKPQRHDIFIVKSGSTTGRIAIVETDENFNIWSPLALVRANEKVKPKFLYYSLQSEYFQKQIQLFWSFGTQPNIGMNVIENLKVVLPSIPEQERIIVHIDTGISKIDYTINQIEKEIQYMQEYQTALISEVVTGKVNVV